MAFRAYRWLFGKQPPVQPQPANSGNQPTAGSVTAGKADSTTAIPTAPSNSSTDALAHSASQVGPADPTGIAAINAAEKEKLKRRTMWLGVLTFFWIYASHLATSFSVRMLPVSPMLTRFIEMFACRWS